MFTSAPFIPWVASASNAVKIAIDKNMVLVEDNSYFHMKNNEQIVVKGSIIQTGAQSDCPPPWRHWGVQTVQAALVDIHGPKLAFLNNTIISYIIQFHSECNETNHIEISLFSEMLWLKKTQNQRRQGNCISPCPLPGTLMMNERKAIIGVMRWTPTPGDANNSDYTTPSPL